MRSSFRDMERPHNLTIQHISVFLRETGNYHWKANGQGVWVAVRRPRAEKSASKQEDDEGRAGGRRRWSKFFEHCPAARRADRPGARRAYHYARTWRPLSTRT